MCLPHRSSDEDSPPRAVRARGRRSRGHQHAPPDPRNNFAQPTGQPEAHVPRRGTSRVRFAIEDESPIPAMPYQPIGPPQPHQYPPQAQPRHHFSPPLQLDRPLASSHRAAPMVPGYPPAPAHQPGHPFGSPLPLDIPLASSRRAAATAPPVQPAGHPMPTNRHGVGPPHVPGNVQPNYPPWAQAAPGTTHGQAAQQARNHAGGMGYPDPHYQHLALTPHGYPIPPGQQNASAPQDRARDNVVVDGIEFAVERGRRR